MIELTFLKESMLMRQANQKSATFVTIGSFLKKGFKFQLNVCNGCHDLLMMSMDLGNVAILDIKGSDYCCIISRIIKIIHVPITKHRIDQKKWNIRNIEIYLFHTKMGKEILTFGDSEIKKKKNFTARRLLFFKKDVGIEKVLVSNKVSSGKKL